MYEHLMLPLGAFEPHQAPLLVAVAVAIVAAAVGIANWVFLTNNFVGRP